MAVPRNEWPAALLLAVPVAGTAWVASDRWHAWMDDLRGYDANYALLTFLMLTPATLGAVAAFLRSRRAFLFLTLVAAIAIALVGADDAADGARYDNSTALVNSVWVATAFMELAMGMFIPLVFGLAQPAVAPFVRQRLRG